MIQRVYVAEDKLEEALEGLGRKADLWVPAASGEGGRVVRFVRYRPGIVPVLDRLATMGPKDAMLPQVETLLRFEYRKEPGDPSRVRVELEEPSEGAPTIIFGAHPCDARGFVIFDPVFTGGPHVDGYYRRRRENTLVATLVCGHGDGACFCSSVGSGPADMEGSDIRITPVAGGYVLEGLSGKASPVIESLVASLGGPASADRQAEAVRVLEEIASRRVGDLDPKGAARAFLERFEDRDYWQGVAGGCLGCGICTFVCPTCYCFTITDEMGDLRGERLRSWDACMFSHYTREASGHNPRPTKLERYRNRVGHKFSYFPQKYGGKIACCGCGRCIRSCPAGIDIRAVVGRLGKEAAHACT